MKKLVNFIQRYKYQILLIFVYLLFFMQMQNVYMYADDYYVRTVFREYDSLISQIYWVYYKSWSGRLIGQFVVHGGLGYFGIQFFRFLNPIFLFMFCYYSSKIINIKKRHNTLQITLFLSLIILGLDSSIIRECLYWADGTILYLWGYIPLLLILYFILDCCINNIKLSNVRFILSIIFIIIISFTMESTAIILISFLFFVSLDNFINKNKSKKILILFILSLVMLGIEYLVPGNQIRILSQDSTFLHANFFGRIIMKIPSYLSYLFGDAIFYILFIISNIFIYCIYNRKKTYNKILKTCGVFLFVFNLIIFINNNIYSFVDFSDFNFLCIITLICLLYLLINIYVGFYISKNGQKYYLYIIISGVLSSLFSVFFIYYTTMRFFLPIIVFFIIYIFKSYYDSDINLKIYILILYILFIDWKLGLILLMVYLILNIKQKGKIFLMKNILIIVVILFNSVNFFKCMYYYSENAKVLAYNEKILNNIDISSINEIHLKKIIHHNYAFSLPENDEFVAKLYYEYYYIQDKTVIWDD